MAEKQKDNPEKQTNAWKCLAIGAIALIGIDILFGKN